MKIVNQPFWFLHSRAHGVDHRPSRWLPVWHRTPVRKIRRSFPFYYTTGKKRDKWIPVNQLIGPVQLV
jgi:hypothetical protein